MNASANPPPRMIRAYIAASLAPLLFAFLCLAAAPPAAGALIGHGGAVTAIAMTPDGKRVLSASFDYSLILWDMAGSEKLRTLSGHEAPVAALAMFPDGRHAVSGSDDRTIGYWDLETGALLARWGGHEGRVAALAVAPDGGLIVSGGWDATLRLWNPAAGESRALRGHNSAINAVAIAPGGALMASGDHDGHILLWSFPEGQLLGGIDGNGFSVNALTFTPAGQLFAASADMTVRLWDPKAKSEIARYEGQDEPLVSLALSPDGDLVAAGGTRGTMMLWKTADGSFIRARYAHKGPVFALAFAPDGQGLLSGGLDGAIRVWRAPDWHERGGAEPAVSAAEPPSDRGARLFRKCGACHELTAAGNGKAGPTLHGLFGRKAGEVPGYAYSPALRSSGIVWDATTIDRLFALGPEEVVPGSKMPLQRMPDAEERAELIRFLEHNTAPTESH
jgi:cytochrome c